MGARYRVTAFESPAIMTWVEEKQFGKGRVRVVRWYEMPGLRLWMEE